MTNIRKAPDDLLEADLRRKRNMAALMKFIPAPVDHPDWSRVRELCAANLVEIVKEKWISEKMPQYIYEAAMEAVYGENIWDWIKNVRK